MPADLPTQIAAAPPAAQADDVFRMLDGAPLAEMLERASALAREGHGRTITYSRKVFIPLTRLCRDVCSYCTFATTPSELASPFLSPDEVLAIAEAGRQAGCHEALFTLGDKPELRYAAARAALHAVGYASTVEYLNAMSALVLRQTGLLPHINAGVMTREEMQSLRRVSVSQGLMLENVSPRLCERGGPHFGSPDKDPSTRLAMIEAAGLAQIPFTTGILIGIGETRRERIESLLALRALHEAHGHLQEIIIQNFRAKPRTRMASATEPRIEELLWTAAAARIIFGPQINIQAPPNLSYASFPTLLQAGINDWGGISPVTPDHVNPEAPWPAIEVLQSATEKAGLDLVPRLAAYPSYVRGADTWIDASVRPEVLRKSDAEGYAREQDWSPGVQVSVPARRRQTAPLASDRLMVRASRGERLSEAEVETLFRARGEAVEELAAAADELRRRTSGDVVRYVVNRNINYTNICTFKCGFCAFSKGKTAIELRGQPYDLPIDQVERRACEAWERGATEVCMQGGIHPSYTGETYLELLRAVKTAAPGLHVHAFSPLEVSHGAASLGTSVPAFLARLRAAGLGSLPGTAAEILDDEVRAVICPDKLSTAEWLSVIHAAHEIGIPTTATIMFGHVERPRHWARHLLAVRDLQERTGGFTEFVPLPFVPMEAPLFRRGKARKGPTWREVKLMHAVARLVLHPVITNVQVSWVKLGPEGAAEMLRSGVNDLGGTLMNESISRAAGTQHGQEFAPAAMEGLISSLGRIPEQRTTLYGRVPEERRERSFTAPPLAPVVLTPLQSNASRSAVELAPAGCQ